MSENNKCKHTALIFEYGDLEIYCPVCWNIVERRLGLSYKKQIKESKDLLDLARILYLAHFKGDVEEFFENLEDMKDHINSLLKETP